MEGRKMAVERAVRKWIGPVAGAAMLAVALAPTAAHQAGAPGTAPQAPAQAGRGGGGQLNDPCGGRSGNPREACPNDVTKMIATLGLLPDKPPATPQKPRKVLIWSRIPSSGYQQ